MSNKTPLLSSSYPEAPARSFEAFEREWYAVKTARESRRVPRAPRSANRPAV
jgi:hypothetical protein